MLRTIHKVAIILACLLLPITASAGTLDFWKKKSPLPPTVNLPMAATSLGEALDAQLVKRLNLLEGPAKGYSLIVTTPVSLNNLESSMPLARQMGEELSAWFVQSGYRLQEIRKGRTILFSPQKGELLLTRRVKLLGNENVRSAIIMATTYSTTMNRIRFNVRLIHAKTNEVLAMANKTIPLTGEMRMLAQNTSSKRSIGIIPSVGTRLP